MKGLVHLCSTGLNLYRKRALSPCAGTHWISMYACKCSTRQSNAYGRRACGRTKLNAAPRNCRTILSWKGSACWSVRATDMLFGTKRSTQDTATRMTFPRAHHVLAFRLDGNERRLHSRTWLRQVCGLAVLCIPGPTSQISHIRKYGKPRTRAHKSHAPKGAWKLARSCKEQKERDHGRERGRDLESPLLA